MANGLDGSINHWHVTDPSDESCNCQCIKLASDARVLQLAVDAADRAFKSWAKTAPRDRGEILRKSI